MGDNYVFGQNIIRDFLFQLQMNGNDLAHPDFKEGIEENTKYILAGMGVRHEDLHYLDYKFKKEGVGNIRVLPNNIVSAMWFCGIFPENCETAFLSNTAIYNGMKYKFNRKTKRLSWEKIKE